MTRGFQPITEKESRKILLDNTLTYFNGDKTKAAESLGVKRETVHNWLNYFGLFEKWKTHNWRPHPPKTVDDGSYIGEVVQT